MSQGNTFDPYRIWLGIPPEEQPPHHYRLLGVRLFESNAEVIANAADARMMHLKTFQAGPYSALSQQLLNAVTAAKLCLLSPESKAAYDGHIRQAIRARSAMVERPLASPGRPTQTPPPQPPAVPHPPMVPQPPVQPPTFKSPAFPPPASPMAPTPATHEPLDAQLARIGNPRVSSYAYRRKNSSLLTATVVVTILAVILGVAILMMTV